MLCRGDAVWVSQLAQMVYLSVLTITPMSTLTPFSVTVMDTIGDLPPLTNGADAEVMDYAGPPVSDFQRDVRKGSDKLRDHICKEMNELNLKRCTIVVSDC